jgi:hypothetical protein
VKDILKVNKDSELPDIFWLLSRFPERKKKVELLWLRYRALDVHSLPKLMFKTYPDPRQVRQHLRSSRN